MNIDRDEVCRPYNYNFDRHGSWQTSITTDRNGVCRYNKTYRELQTEINKRRKIRKAEKIKSLKRKLQQESHRTALMDKENVNQRRQIKRYVLIPQICLLMYWCNVVY